MAIAFAGCSDSEHSSTTNSSQYYWEDGVCKTTEDDKEWNADPSLCEGYYWENGTCYNSDDKEVTKTFCQNSSTAQYGKRKKQQTSNQQQCVWNGQVIDEQHCLNGTLPQQDGHQGQYQNSPPPCLDHRGQLLPPNACSQNLNKDHQKDKRYLPQNRNARY